MVTKLSYHDGFLDKQVEIVRDKSVLIDKNKIIVMASMPLPLKSFIVQCRMYTYLHTEKPYLKITLLLLNFYEEQKNTKK